MLFMGAFGLVFLLVPGLLMRAFTDSPELIAAGRPILRVMGLVQVIDAVGLTLAGALRGAGETRKVMLVDLVHRLRPAADPGLALRRPPGRRAAGGVVGLAHLVHPVRGGHDRAVS